MRTHVLLLTLPFVLIGGCDPATAPATPRRHAGVTLELVAQSRAQWTGVAVSAKGRIFVNYPRWSASVPISVAELGPGGRVLPYPNRTWNQWRPGAPGDAADPATRFVCVQSVVVDDKDRLWILDPANPRFAGVVPGGAKLVQVDLGQNKVLRTIAMDATVAPARSYLNDVRIDTQTETAYITESGLGAIVVVDLKTGKARRVLDKHPSTRSEGAVLTIGGRPWRRPDGSVRHVHADGVALSADRRWLYWQALTGKTLYRLETAHLRDATLSPTKLASRVQKVATVGASDGLLMDRAGNVYLSSLEHDAIRRLRPTGRVETVISDPRIAWPDSFAWSKGRGIYFTTSQIHRMPSPVTPYRIYRFTPTP